MPSSTRAQQSAPVVQLSSFRVPRTRIEHGPRLAADLLSVRQSLSCEASVEIDNLDRLSDCLTPTMLASMKRRVRQMLDREFGRLRVHRHRRRFVVRHRSVDNLIAGLLRVQFHAQQIRLPETDRYGNRLDPSMISLTWGVGQSGPEAELERLRRRGRK